MKFTNSWRGRVAGLKLVVVTFILLYTGLLNQYSSSERIRPNYGSVYDQQLSGWCPFGVDIPLALTMVLHHIVLLLLWIAFTLLFVLLLLCALIGFVYK